MYQTEISTCVSAKEAEDMEEYAFLKVWADKFSSPRLVNTLHSLDLASLKIYKSCSESRDLLNVLESDSQKILTGAMFRFPGRVK